jgi:DNA-binding transcriptional ArsR family regulator
VAQNGEAAAQPAPAQMTISDPQIMRALAHPARFAILQYLSADRTATATECAEVVGLSPSATSYHLRALAKAGLVEEAPSRGDGRERVWQGRASEFTIDAGRDASDEAHAAEREAVQAFMAHNDAEMLRWLDRARQEPNEWYDATVFRRSRLVLTAAELTTLTAAMDDLIKPYSRAAHRTPPEGARTVALVYWAVPMDTPVGPGVLPSEM